MREYSTPLSADLGAGGNLADDLLTNAASSPDRVCLSRRTAGGWADVTASEFLDEVRAAAKGLLASGVEPGGRVALLSRTRYEWTLLDYAIWYAGGVTVPIYETASADQIEWILSDSGCFAVIAESGEHARRITEVGPKLDQLEQTWLIENGALDELSAAGAAVSDEDLDARRSAVTSDSVATIIYTSGTTGRPKGCTITHGNFQFELGSAVTELHELFDDPDAATLLFLPLAHVFARIIQVGAIKAGVRMGHSSDVKHLLADLASFRPTFILAVPRVFEKIFNTASQESAADGRGKVFDLAAETAIKYSRAQESGRPGPWLRGRHALFERLVYAKLRNTLGGRCRYAVSGGAPLGERLGHFFRGIGLVVLEGYGLTETTAAATVNLPAMTKIGTVGRPLAGTTVSVADDGELMVRGGQVFQGYWNNPGATDEILDTSSGWLHTGDLGEIDDEGFVRITGRKKEIIVTAGGKNVAPSTLEDRIRAHPLVSQCMVVGDGQPFIAALVTLDPEGLTPWAQKRGKSLTPADLMGDSDVVAEVQAAVDEANKAVSQAESIRKFKILPVDWTEESGELTPSLKLRRNVILRRFREDIEGLYDRTN